jgi:hypothetical protein
MGCGLGFSFKRQQIGRNAMPRFHVSAALWATLAILSVGFSSDRAFAVSPAGAAEAAEETIPQGEDPPGADDDAGTPPPVEHNGVITPPPTGDEGIHTEAPVPDAGNDEEVIPPPGTPGGKPDAVPR